MPVLLHIDSSPLPTSVSREVTLAYAKAWVAAHPQGDVIYRDLGATVPAPLDAAWVYAAFTPEPARVEAQSAALAISDELIEELERADEYVIGVAMHNFTIPSRLKLWIDQVARVGKTFSYGPDGPKGLLAGKKATIIVASGGVYDAGTPAAPYDFVEPYLRAMLGFLGVTDVTFVKVGGTSSLASGKVTREALLEPALLQVRKMAA